MAKKVFLSNVQVTPLQNGSSWQLYLFCSCCPIDDTNNFIVEPNSGGIPASQIQVLTTPNFLMTLSSVRAQLLAEIRNRYSDQTLIPVWIDDIGLL